MRDLPPDFCPYKGLQPYTAEDREFFFGRERDSELIASNLYASSLTVLYGASGVGKSSVLLAGVVPNLSKDPGCAVVVYRDWQDASFLRALKREVLNALSRFPGRRVVVDPKLPLDEFLAQSGRGLRVSVLFVFDQFEEYFLYHPPDPRQSGFEAEFARAVNRRDVDANFLIGVREDALSRLDRFQGRIPHLLANRLRLDHLRPSDAEEAVLKPLAEYNERRRPGSRPVAVQGLKDLAAKVIEQVKIGRVVLGDAGQGHPGVRPPDRADEFGVETPFLQLVMTRLWDEATRPGADPPAGEVALGVELLDRLGGAKTIVRSHLDKVMESELDPGGRDTASRLFRFLVTPTGTKVAHTVQDLAKYVGRPVDRIEAVVSQLCSQSVRVLRPVTSGSGRNETTRFEIFHDVLAPAVLDWSRRQEVAAKVKLQRQKQRRRAEIQKNRRVAEVERLRAEAERLRAEEAVAAAVRLKVRNWQFLGVATVAVVLAVAAGWLAYESNSLKGQATAAATEAKLSADLAKYKETLAVENERRARAETRIATSRQLAFLSVSELKGRLDVSLLLAVEALRTENTFEARDSLYKALQERPEVRAFLHAREGNVHQTAFSPDGKTLAAGYGTARAGGVVLWDVATGRRLTADPLPVNEGDVTSVAFSHDGATLAAGYGLGGSGGVVLWDVAARRRLGDEPLAVKEGPVATVAFRPEGTTLAAGYGGVVVGGGVVVWDLASRLRLGDEPLAVKEGAVITVAFSHDGKALAAGYDNVVDPAGGVVLWDVDGLRRRAGQPLVVSEGPVYGVAFSPDGKALAAGCGGVGASTEGGVVLWDVGAARRLATHPLPVSEGPVYGVAFSPDGKALAAGFNGDRVGAVLWDVATRQRREPGRFLLREGPVYGVAFSPDGKALAAGYGGTTESGGGVVLWDVAARPRLASEPWPVSEGPVGGVAFSPDGTTLAAGYRAERDGGVLLWDVATGKRLDGAPFLVEEGYVARVAFRPDGKALAAGYRVVGGVRGGVVLWDPASGRRLAGQPLAVTEGAVGDVAFSPDGTTLAAGYGASYGAGGAGGVVLWDAASGRRLAGQPLAVGEGDVVTLAFSPDGKTLAAGYRGEGGVALWDLATRRRLERGLVPVKEGVVRSVAFGPGGKTLAVGYRTGIVGGVLLWDLSTHKRLAVEELPVKEGYVGSVAFRPTPKALAAGFGVGVGYGGGVVLWDADAFQRLIGEPFPVKEGNVAGVAFSHDGKALAAGFDGGAVGGVVVLDVDLVSWQHLARRIANRNLSRAEWRRYFPDKPYHPTFPDLPVPPEETPEAQPNPRPDNNTTSPAADGPN